MVNVFLKPPSGSGFYVSRSAVLRCHHLETLLLKAEAEVLNPASPVELAVPDLPRAAFLKAMEHCERAHPDESKDIALIDGLDIEVLLQLVGVAHRLGALHLLNLSASRVAKQLSEVLAAAKSERASVPMDVYLRPDPEDALDSDDALSAVDEFIFALPDAHDAPPDESPLQPAAPVHSPSKSSQAGRYTGAHALPGVPFNAHLVRSAESAVRERAAAGTGDARKEQRLGFETSADRLVQVLGGEAPLLAVLVKLDLSSLRMLKPLGKRWRYRARAALCSGAWAEGARSLTALDIGKTRHWEWHERTAMARFLSNGSFARLQTFKADGFEASLPCLLELERISTVTLLEVLMSNPSQLPISGTDAWQGSLPDSDALCAQSEFLALLALWALSSSHVLREADVSALTFSGLLPLIDALGPAVELASRRVLERLFLSSSTNALPVRDLVGLPPPPPPVSSPLGSAPSTDRVAAASIDLKWKGLGALDASLIAFLLRANRTITRLDLSWNSNLKAAGSRGAEELAEAIGQSRTLADVDLSETGLGDGIAGGLRKLIISSPSLTRLNLRSCGLGLQAREDLVKAAATRPKPLDLLI